MMRWIAALTGSLVLIAGGIVHGFWTDRWSTPPETTRAIELMHAVPLEIGDWDGKIGEVKRGEGGEDVAGCIKRSYVNRKTGNAISLFLVCGRFGPVSIHDPETCYGASGFVVGSKGKYDAESFGQMWKTDAARSNATETKSQRLYWGWNSGEGWTAPNDPRKAFVGRPLLYKLYVVRDLDGLTESGRSEPCEEFLRVLLPTLKTTLFDSDS